MPGLKFSAEFGVNVLQEIIASAYDFLKKDQKKKDFFKVQTQKYVEKMIERHGKVKVLGQRDPTDLMSLYVRANIIEKITARVGGNIKELEEFFDLEKRSFYKQLETKDGEEIANELQKFIVLGKPGAGKTTFLRYIALAMLHEQSRIKNRRLPIFVTLRDWADEQNTLMEYMARQFDICGFTDAGLFVENALKQGNCLVLFDGLDEVSQESNLDEIIREIRDFSDKYSSNQFVISCRVAAYNHWFEQFTDVEMADFNDQQIEAFVGNWFGKEPKTGQACLERLQSTNQLKELATIPLLLTLMCITFEEDNDFPRNRSELYERAIEALLTKWDSSRRIRRRNPYQQLSTRRKKDLFSQIAWKTFLEDKYFIRERELVKMIEEFIVHMLEFDQNKLEAESKEVLKSIEAQHGIFVERARNIYSFGHLTFQEYFTAKYLAELDAMDLSDQLVKRFLFDSKWAEVFLLVAGMIPRADKFLEQMLKKNRSLLRHNFLNQILIKTQDLLLDDHSGYSPMTRTSIALFLILSISQDLVRGHAQDLIEDSDRHPKKNWTIVQAGEEFLDVSLAVDLARNLTEVLLLVQDKVHNLDLSLGPNPQQVADRAIDLLEELDQDKNFEWKLVHEFLSATTLILDCLNTDCYVSNEVRQEILDNLFAPLREEEEGGE